MIRIVAEVSAARVNVPTRKRASSHGCRCRRLNGNASASLKAVGSMYRDGPAVFPIHSETPVMSVEEVASEGWKYATRCACEGL